MDKLFEGELVKAFPEIFREYGGDIRNTCMGWGMSCEDGWFDLLYDMCYKVDSLIKNQSREIKVVAKQVKEKFGGLRFYYSIEREQNLFEKIDSKISSFMFRHKLGRLYHKINDFRKKFYTTIIEQISDIISEAEMKSYKTCEVCGRYGERRGGGWIKTLCNECDEKRNKDA